jgi:hypothetical protein
LTKLVGAGPGSFMVKRSGESFSTPHRAARSPADLKRFASVRSPLGNPAGVTFGRRVSAPRCSVPIFRSRRAHVPWAKTAGRSARPQAPSSHRELPRSQPFVFNRILPWADLRGSQDLVVGGKRREGGEGCAIIIFPRDFGGFSESAFSLSRVSYWPSGPSLRPLGPTQMVSQRCDGPTNVSVPA